jgi:hypothetical protein
MTPQCSFPTVVRDRHLRIWQYAPPNAGKAPWRFLALASAAVSARAMEAAVHEAPTRPMAPFLGGKAAWIS